MILISSNINGWQLEAMRLASTRDEFILFDVEERHYYLVNELQAAYNYRIEVRDNLILFTPFVVSATMHCQAA